MPGPQTRLKHLATSIHGFAGVATQTWVDVPGGDATSNTLVWRHFSFAPITTDRIRVLVNNGNNGNSRVVEIEAWSAYGPAGYALPTVTLGASSATSGAGLTVTAPAAVALSANASAPDGAITKVEFRRDGSNTPIGTATAAPWQITWANAAAGLYAVSAVAYDTAPNNAASSAVSVQVGSPLVVQITTPASGAVIPVGTNVTITGAATRDGIAAPITSMRFYRNGTELGIKTAAPYTWAWNNVTSGSYALEVRAYEANGSYTQSSPIAVTVPPRPLINMLAPDNNSSLQLPGSITLSATANPGDGNSTIAKVDFLLINFNSAVVGTVTSPGPNSTYSFVWTPTLAGTYYVGARATDTLGSTAWAGPTYASSRRVDVLAGPATVSVISPANNQRFTAPATIPLSFRHGGRRRGGAESGVFSGQHLDRAGHKPRQQRLYPLLAGRAGRNPPVSE